MFQTTNQSYIITYKNTLLAVALWAPERRISRGHLLQRSALCRGHQTTGLVEPVAAISTGSIPRPQAIINRTMENQSSWVNHVSRISMAIFNSSMGISGS